MQAHETAGAADFRANLTRHLIDAEHRGGSVVITRNGRPAAVLVPWGWLRELASELSGAPLDDDAVAGFLDPAGKLRPVTFGGSAK